MMRLYNKKGTYILVRVLFDMGSEVNLIMDKCAGRANLKRKKFSLELESVLSTETIDYGYVNAKLMPWYDTSEENFIFKSLVIMKKLPIAQRTEVKSDVTEFRDLVKADPHFYRAGGADVLLGIDTWAEIVMNDVKWSSCGLCAQATKFGYAIFGSVEPTESLKCTVASLQKVIDDRAEYRLDELLTHFWEQEELSDETKFLSPDEQCAEDHYKRNTYRADDGRFVASLPFRQEDTELGESRRIALERFYQLERRLDRNKELKEKYHQAIREDIEAGYMRFASAEERRADGYYIPHHPVTKRFRVVLDGSCATTNGKSVNDIQLAGTNLQEKLATIIMRFRFHKIVLSADIRKMFKQIKLNDADLRYQKIFWRFSSDEPVREYVLVTVIFGYKSSPFLAARTMFELAQIFEQKYPLASRATRLERYVDDFMSGGDTIEDAMNLYHQLRAMLGEAHFELSKWKTNCREILEVINEDLNENDVPLELNDETTSILGLKWIPSSDCFVFKIEENLNENIPITKRAVSSAVARIYDPSGYLAPIVIKAKAFLQELWKREVQWDEPLDTEFSNRWRNFYRGLIVLNELKIPRWIQTTKGREIELFGFADAAELGYGAVVYVRCVSGAYIWCNLLTSKTKLAPIKTLTIERLELCAAELLARLISVVRKKCFLEYAPFRCFSDSKITLAWIGKCPSTLKVFAATRVKTIQKHVPKEQWSHVPSELNPADLASRGLSAEELLTNDMWWHGPQFLFRNPILLPSRERKVLQYTEEELKVVRSEFRPAMTARISIPQEVVAHKIKPNGELVPLIKRYGHLDKIVRITAYVFKYFNKIRRQEPSEPNTLGLLSNELLVKALNYWIKREQNIHFHDEMKKKQANKGSKLAALCPFLDKDGIMRLQGRISNANVTYDEKHPMIVPNHSLLSKLLLQEAHRNTEHGGIQLMLHYVRSRYWIIGARKGAASIVKSCLRCIRYAKNDMNQIMGELPKERVSTVAPFTYCGVDYFGPIKVKRFEHRCRTLEAGYGAVFVCFTTRMVHVECVSDLTTQKFLWALQRLSSIYRTPELMFSDNAKTFEGAGNELIDVLKSWTSEAVEQYLTVKGIKWRFITPRAPNQGGLWEAAVKSAKHHLKRILCSHILTFERYQTVFAKISAILNSRPLVPLADDPTELNYLTPAHAVRGERIVQPLGRNLSAVPINRVDQHRLLDKIQQEFWEVWRKEYIKHLQSRYKWNRAERNIAVGDLVLLKIDNVPPGIWPVARVMEVYPGADGFVRSVKIKTPTSEFVRPINKLILIAPIESSNAEPNDAEKEEATTKDVAADKTQ